MPVVTAADGCMEVDGLLISQDPAAGTSTSPFPAPVPRQVRRRLRRPTRLGMAQQNGHVALGPVPREPLTAT
jgi:hypothetical protein